MTVKDLQNDVYALGFERVTDPDDLFISAANRALRIIYTERKYKNTVAIRAESAAISSHVSKIRYTGSVMTLPLVGRAYSMRVCGMGRFVIKDGESIITENFDTDDKLYRGFLRVGGTLTLEGDYSYTVYDLTTYSEILSDRIDSIPDGSGRISIDFSEYPDFLSFASLPKDARGREIKGANINGSVLSLYPSGTEVFVTYNKMPRKISADDFSLEIDIPRSAEASLSLMCASFLWREDSPEIADQYFSLARELLSGSEKTPESKIAKYTVTDGWA